MDDSGFPDGNIAATDAAKILKGSDYAVLSRARANVESAEQEAAEIISQAHRDAEQIRAEALATGMQQSSAYLAESAARVSRDLDELEPRLCGIVMDALHRILDPIPAEKQIVAAVRRALSEVDLSRGVTLVVAPAMLAGVQDQLGQFPPHEGIVEAVGDPTCDSNAAVLRTLYGDIELDFEAQLAALNEGLQTALMEDRS